MRGRNSEVGTDSRNGPMTRQLTVARRTPIERLLSPFQRFAETESSGGVVLLAATAIALLWANSPLSNTYPALWETRLSLHAGPLGLDLPLRHWINDGLMAVFFFLVGLEIKREFLWGEFASARQALLPVAAAIGGMLLPAAIYAAVNANGAGAAGWGIPMATDIAFALGILALLGPRVPTGLKVFLAALAIVDDIGAVLVIAIFYTTAVSWQALGLAAAALVGALLANRAGVRSGAAYAALGILLWLALHASGVHATIAGILLAAAVPARPHPDGERSIERCRDLAEQIGLTESGSPRRPPSKEQLQRFEELEAVSRLPQSPAQRLERRLHPWVAFGIVPLFALANAGVRVIGHGEFDWRIVAGVVLGLVLGKPLGITTASWVASRLTASRPEGTSWLALHGVSWLGGIGFTMSLFIAQLAFESDGALASAKVGVLAASALAAALGSGVLLRLPGRSASVPMEEELSNV